MSEPLYFENIAVGETWTSLGRTITEADVVNFAGMTGDYDPLHVDHEFARQTPFGKPIAHGLLGLSLVAGLSSHFPCVKTIAFMKANKDFVVASESKTIGVKPSIASKIYDAQIGGFSTDGAWSLVAIDVIRHSLKELGILNTVPDAKTIYNDQFVPVKF